MFINMLCHISQGIFLDPGHPLPSLLSSVGLQTALIRKTKHQETDVILMALSHYIPFLPSQNISYLLSWSFEICFPPIQGKVWNEFICHLILSWLP